MGLAETAVLAVELKLNGATAFKTGIAEDEAALAGLNRTAGASHNVLGGTASNLGLVKQAAVSTGAALGGMASHLKSVITGPLGMIGLGAGLFTLAGAFKESVGMAQELGLATEKLTALTGENAAQVSTQVAVFQKYGISIDQAATLIGFAEKTLGKLAETSTPAAKGGLSVAKAQDAVRIASERLKVAHERLIEVEHKRNLTASQLTAAQNRVTDATVKLHQAQTALAGASDAPAAGLSKLQAIQKQYGITLTDSKGRAVDFETELRNVSDFYVSGAAASTKAYVASQLFGRGYQALIPVLRLGSEGIKEAEQAAKDLGLTLTSENAAELREYQKNIRETGDAVSGLQLQLGLALIPTVGDLAKSLTAFLRDGGTGKIVTFFKGVVESAKELGAVVTGTVIPTIQGLASTAKGFWDSIPAPLRDLIFKGVVADRTIHFLFGVSPLSLGKNLIGDVLGPIIGHFADRGSSPANPVFVSGAGIGGIGDLAGGAAGAGGVSIASVVALAAVPLIPLVAAYFLAGGESGIATRDLAGRQATAAARGLNPANVPVSGTPGYADWLAQQTGRTGGMSPDERQAAADQRQTAQEQLGVARRQERAEQTIADRVQALAKQFSPAELLSIYQKSAAARGFVFDPHAPASTSLKSRFSFLGAGHKGSQDVAVADALAAHFLTGTSPLYTSDKNLAAAIKVLQTDAKTLHGGDRKAIEHDIAVLKAEQARRTKEAADKTARAATIAGQVAAQAIRDKNLSVTVPVSNNTYFNGRLIDANLGRYTSTVVGSKGAFAEFG